MYFLFSAMQQKIYRLVVANFCCWVPISVITFSTFLGADISSNAYTISAVVLLPINSALDPILYFDTLAFLKRILRSKPTIQRLSRRHKNCTMVERSEDLIAKHNTKL